MSFEKVPLAPIRPITARENEQQRIPNAAQSEENQIDMIGPMANKVGSGKNSFNNRTNREMNEIRQNNRRSNINDQSVPDILSTLDDGAPDREADLFLHSNKINLNDVGEIHGCCDNRKTVTVCDEDFIKISRMVEEYDRK